MVGQGVVLGHGQSQAVGTEVQYLQATGNHGAGDDAQVGRTVEHAAHDVAIELFLQVDGHAGALGEKTGQDLRQQFGDRRGVGEDADMPRGVGAVVGELALEVLHLPQNQAGMVQQALARRGHLHAAVVAVQQTIAQLPLEGLDPRAGRRRRQAGLARALGQAGGFGNMDEQAQVSQVEMHGALAEESRSILAFGQDERWIM
ncbi:hypothetical protein D3C86_1458770 [compost metagenome]